MHAHLERRPDQAPAPPLPTRYVHTNLTDPKGNVLELQGWCVVTPGQDEG